MKGGRRTHSSQGEPEGQREQLRAGDPERSDVTVRNIGRRSEVTAGKVSCHFTACCASQWVAKGLSPTTA